MSKRLKEVSGQVGGDDGGERRCEIGVRSLSPSEGQRNSKCKEEYASGDQEPEDVVEVESFDHIVS